MELVHTGIFLTEEEVARCTNPTLAFDPTALISGPRRGSSGKEPWQILQEIAGEKGLPPNDDYYGMTEEREIIYRKR